MALMPLLNTMFSVRSTYCSLFPMNGTGENQQMVDTPTFSDRLDAALAMNGLDNAGFASFFGESGQQTVNRWRARGRVGGPSFAKVRDILRNTSMDWLQEGIGEPERLNASSTDYLVRDLRQSYAARLDVHILAKAVRVMAADTYKHGAYPPLKHATRLMGYYERLEKGAQQADLIAQVLELDDDQGSEHVYESQTGADGKRD